MKKTRILSLLLAIIMVLSAILAVSCSDTTDPVTTTAKASTEDNGDQTGENTDPAATEPTFSDRVYEGQTFTIYMRNSTASTYAGSYIFPADDGADVMTSEAEVRNARVEEKFKVKLEFKEIANPTSTVVKDIKDGNTAYNVILDQRYKIGPVAQQQGLTSFTKIGVDLTTTWWDANAAYAYSAYNNVYTMPCDVSVANLGGTRFYCFNKAVLENFHLTSPYEYVNKNEWTLENFYKLVKSVSAPDASGGVGVYGLVNEVSNIRNAMLDGIGVPWIEKLGEDKFEVTIATTYKDKAQEYFDGLKVIFNDTSCVMDFDTAHTTDAANQGNYKDKYAHCRGLFATDHFLFVHTNMLCIKSQFGDMSKGFGIVMNPKWNSDQEKYYHRMDSNSISWAIPAFSDNDLQMVGDIMDYWAYQSSKTVMVAFYELTLKAKRANDPTASETLDVIKSSINYYITELLSTEIGSFVTSAYDNGVTAAWAKYEKSLPKAINAQLAKFQTK